MGNRNVAADFVQIVDKPGQIAVPEGGYTLFILFSMKNIVDLVAKVGRRRVGAMEFRIVQIDDERVAYLFELYAAWVLETPYNSFATS